MDIHEKTIEDLEKKSMLLLTDEDKKMILRNLPKIIKACADMGMIDLDQVPAYRGLAESESQGNAADENIDEDLRDSFVKENPDSLASYTRVPPVL